jgi:hypothetical protein
MGWFWLAVALVLATLFGGFALFDRRARRRGHRSRSSSAIAADIRERDRDARAYDSQRVPGNDLSWTAHFRRYEASDPRTRSD